MLQSKFQMLFALFLSSLLKPALSHPNHQPSWTPLTPLPLPRQEHTTVLLAAQHHCRSRRHHPHQYHWSATHHNNISRAVLLNSKQHMEHRGTPATRMNHINAAVVDGRIYVLGGLAEQGEVEPAWRGVGDAFVYSPSTDAWTRLPSLPDWEARGSAAMGVYGSKIVLAGGMTDLELSGNRSQNTVAVVSVFDTKSGKWEVVSEEAKFLPEARDHAAAAVVEGKMYVLGGREQGQENVKDTVFVLDLGDLEAGWSVSGARMPTPRGGVAAGVVGKQVYVLGGEGNAHAETGVFGEVEAYDTRKDRWSSAGGMRIPKHGAYAVGVGKKSVHPWWRSETKWRAHIRFRCL